MASEHWEDLLTPIGLKPTGNVPSVLGGSTGVELVMTRERRVLVRAVHRFATIVQLYPREQEKKRFPRLGAARRRAVDRSVSLRSRPTPCLARRASDTLND